MVESVHIEYDASVLPSADQLRTRSKPASSGITLLLLTAFFYVPIFALEFNTELALEGINYVGDTLLFAATVLVAGFGVD